MGTQGVNGWRFPTYTDSPDVPRDLGYLGQDIADFIAAHPGPQGAQGPAATIEIGTITTVPSTTQASVVNVGTTSAARFNFTIPRGVDGVVGGPGPANVLTLGTVIAGDPGTQPIVTITGTTPSQTINFVIPKGDTGPKGDAGATGPKGDAAATIAVNSTTTGSAGTNASVTNSGTSSAVKLDFVIPRGADGATGATGPAGPAGANAIIDPIATKISLTIPALSTTGVSSHWYPFQSGTQQLGLLGPLNSGTDNTTRAWKTAILVTSANVISDVRTKENIETSDLGLSFINTLHPVKYKRKDGNRTHYGLIAQEVKSTLDDLNISDFAGWVISDVDDPDGHQALRYEEFISPLIKAVQELTARVLALESK